MVTRTHTPLKSNFLRTPICRIILLSGSSLLVTANSYAGELEIKPEMSLDYYKVDSRSAQSGSDSEQTNLDVDDQVIKYTPAITLIYKSKIATLTGFSEYVKTEHQEAEETNSEFLNYNLLTSLELLPESLIWQASARKSHRVADSRLGVFSDEIVGSENLTGVTNLQTNLTYQLVNQQQFSLLANTFYTKSKADDSVEADLTESNFAVNNFDTNSKGASLTVGSGAMKQGVGWQLDMSISKSDRRNQEDYTQARFSSDLDIPLSQSFGWVLNGTINKNKIDNDTALSDGLTYREYGTGLRWSFTRESYINLLAYRSKTGEQETRSYVGGEFNWNPSARSSLLFSANRNQFGENYQLDLTQNSRFIKTRASYREGIDINSRRQFISGVVGSFVCPIDTLDFTQCFQPIEPDYQLQPGEQQFDIVGQDIELNDEVVKFSSGSFNIGYDNTRKLKLNLSYVYTEQEGLEGLTAGNDRKSESISLAAAYAISPKTQAVLNTRFNQNTYYSELNSRVDDNTSISFFINSKLSRRLSAQVGLSRRERNSVASDNYDNRFNAQVNYRY